MSQKSSQRALVGAVREALPHTKKATLIKVCHLMAEESDWEEDRDALLVTLADAKSASETFQEEQAAAVKARDERRQKHKEGYEKRSALDRAAETGDAVATASGEDEGGDLFAYVDRSSTTRAAL